MTGIKPLVLDVDGTFLKTDLLWETFWAGLGKAPIATLKACVRHLNDRAALKAALARIAPLRLDLLPVNGEVADLALQSRVGIHRNFGEGGFLAAQQIFCRVAIAAGALGVDDNRLHQGIPARTARL